MNRSSVRPALQRAIAILERGIDRASRRLGGDLPTRVRLLTYAGYRTATRLHVKGRVVRHGPTLKPGETTFARMRAMLAIYNSHELPGVRVRLEGFGQGAELDSDEEGYFAFDLPIDSALPDKTAWESVTIATPEQQAQADRIPVPVLAPGMNLKWGIISDIDDTIVETGATDFLKNWRRVLVDRPQDRIIVPGAATLYKMIAVDHKAPARPFFYVSSSPWNLYGFITEFMELNGMPHGPMFLKDYGIDDTKLIDTGHDEHKLAAIETILATYPQLRFLLIGDNGQRDVTIYAKVVEDFGTRVAAVFIRDVDGSCRTGPEAELLRGIEARGVPTFCGASFDDAVSVLAALDVDRPAEAASAVTPPSPGPMPGTPP